MDRRSFDDLTRKLADLAGRRQVLRVLVGAGIAEAAAVIAARRNPDGLRRPAHREDGQCGPAADRCAPPAIPAVASPGAGERSRVEVVLAAGDIAACDSIGDEATADLLDVLEGTVIPLGDTAYQSGTPEEFAQCYDPTWGRHKARTRPAVGDHEYNTPNATGYFAYFGDAAGKPDEGYYSFDLGAWHVIILNSNCSRIGGCDSDSPQVRWLRADLAANPAPCTLAVIHHPLYSSGVKHGGNQAVRPFWDALYEAGADIVLSGNEHNYERFAPQNPTGGRDDQRGIRQFVVGTGGVGLYPLGPPIANSEVQNDHTWGVIELTLSPGGYDWRFIPVEGQDFTDAGSATCSPLVREFPVVADAGVRRHDPYANLGTAPLIEVDENPESLAYLRFDVRDLPGSVGKAMLRLYVPPGEQTGRGPEIYGVDNDWTETTVTWQNRPRITGGPYDAREQVRPGSWVEFDVTEAVTGDGAYSFAVVPRSEDGFAFVSREGLMFRPRLVLFVNPDDVTRSPTDPAAGRA